MTGQRGEGRRKVMKMEKESRRIGRMGSREMKGQEARDTRQRSQSQGHVGIPSTESDTHLFPATPPESPSPES